MKTKITEADAYVSIWVILLPFMLIVLPLLFGCYNSKKAAKQFSRAVVTNPKLPADYCAFYFPSKDTTIKGDSILVTDTLFMAGELTTDTLIEKDTVRITITRTVPKIITNTIHIRDTVFQENTAKLRSCEIDKSSLIDQLNKSTIKADKYEAKAKKRGLILWGLILLIALYTGWNIYKRLKPLAK